jgi:hypothetical protein
MFELVVHKATTGPAKVNQEMSCFSPIYCFGDLLKTVQLANIFSDSKTFVDMKQRQPPVETLRLFEEFMAQTGGNPSRDQVQEPSE